MSLVSAFVDAFKKAASRDRRMEAAQEAVKGGQAGTLGSTPGPLGGSFDPLRPAPVPGDQTAVDFKVEVTEAMATQTSGDVVAEPGLSGAPEPVANKSPQHTNELPGEPEKPSDPGPSEGDLGPTTPPKAPFDPVEVDFGKQGTSAGLAEDRGGGALVGGKDLDEVAATDIFAKIGDIKAESLAPAYKFDNPDFASKIGDIKGESGDDKHREELFNFRDRSDDPVQVALDSAGKDPFKIEVEDAISLPPNPSGPIPIPYPIEAESGSDALQEVARKAGKGQQEYLEVKLQEAFITRDSPELKVDAAHPLDDTVEMEGVARKAGEGQRDWLGTRETGLGTREAPEWKVEPGSHASNTLVDLDAETDAGETAQGFDDVDLGDIVIDADTDVEDLEV